MSASIDKQIAALWEEFLDSVVNADIDKFSTFFSESEYISHMGLGTRQPNREDYLKGIDEVFNQATRAGDQDALQQRHTYITVLGEDLALCQHHNFMRDTNVYYAISALFKLGSDGWKIVHTHDSFGLA